MKVGVQIGEGGPLSWDRWRHIIQITESLGFNSLFRCDHYYNGLQKDSIDVFLGFVAAGLESSRIRLGTLVTPVTFREPVNVGRAAQQLDALTGGRFVLGLGAGWFAEEHERFGLDYPPTKERFDRLEEAIEMMRVLWYSEDGHFDGEFYRLAGTNSQPHPPAGRPEILIGGTGAKRTLNITAKYADEWNAPARDFETFRAASETLDRHCEALGRDPSSIRRSALVFTDLSPDEETRQIVLRKLIDMSTPGKSVEEVAAAGRLPWQGSLDQFVDFVGRLGELGVEEIMFDHAWHESDVIPEFYANDVMPRIADL